MPPSRPGPPSRTTTSSSLDSKHRLPGYASSSRDVLCRVRRAVPFHPAQVAFFASLDLSKDSICLWTGTQGGITVCPQSMTGSQNDLEGWGREAGYVLIVSTTRRRIDRITVKLVSRQSLSFPDDKGKREDDEVFRREIALDEDDDGPIWLDKGLNTFEFCLNLPPDMPITVTVSEQLARVHHFVIATAVGSAKGLFGKDMIKEEKVYAMSAPADHDDLEFNYHSVGFHDGLGPWTFDSSSSLFTVAGAIFFSFKLASPPPSLRVYAFQAFVKQTHHITSFRDKNKTTTLVKKAVIFERGWEGPYTNKALDRLKAKGKEATKIVFDGSVGSSDGWTLEDVGRIPPAQLFPPGTPYTRASTDPLTKTCVRTSTELIVEIFFTTESSPSSKSDLLIAEILCKPVHLHSCACVPGRLSLPDYAPTPELHPTLDAEIPCRCDESQEKVFEAEWAYVRAQRAAEATSLARRRGSEGAPERRRAEGRQGRKIGEIH